MNTLENFEKNVASLETILKTFSVLLADEDFDYSLIAISQDCEDEKGNKFNPIQLLSTVEVDKVKLMVKHAHCEMVFDPNRKNDFGGLMPESPVTELVLVNMFDCLVNFVRNETHDKSFVICVFVSLPNEPIPKYMVCFTGWLSNPLNILSYLKNNFQKFENANT